MSKTIKVIGLLYKIANGEEVPKKIKYNNLIYNWDITGYLHYEDEHTRERAFLEGYRTDKCLNDEVEILEDNTEEIEELPEIDIQGIEELPKWVTRRDGEVTQQEGKRLEMADKINQLVQAVKQLDNQINNK